MDKFTIVIPVYNEAKNLKILVPKIYYELENKKFEIIIVDDNSTDTTKKVLKKFKKKIFITSLEKIKEIYQNHVFWVLKNQSTTI